MSKEKSLAITKLDNYLRSPDIDGMIQSMMQGAAINFLADVRTLCFNNPKLAECDHNSLLGCALKSYALGLRLDPQFGQAFIIPYKKSVKINGIWEKVPIAQFQMGVRGWIQLAMKTREYTKINAMTVKEGEFVGRDMFGDPIIKFLPESERTEKPVSGYMAAFQMINGMVKVSYWSIEEFEKHASRYSEAYRNYKKDKKSDNVWATSYDQMGEKTVLSHLLKKYGYMSEEMLEAYKSDQAVLNVDIDTGEITGEYIDNTPPEKIEMISSDQLKKLISLVGNVKERQDKAVAAIKSIDNLSITTLNEIPADRFDEVCSTVEEALTEMDIPTEEKTYELDDELPPILSGEQQSLVE